MFLGEVFIGELMIKDVFELIAVGYGLAKGRYAVLFMRVDSGLTYCIIIFLLPLGDNPFLLGD